MNDKDIKDIQEVTMDPEKETLSKAVEAELIGASAFMEAEELLDGEGPD